MLYTRILAMHSLQPVVRSNYASKSSNATEDLFRKPGLTPATARIQSYISRKLIEKV